MRRALRIVLAVVVLLVVLALAAPFLISVNQFRPTIEEQASAALGRSVRVGNLSLSIFEGSLSAEQLSIGDDPAFGTSPFLTAARLQVGVKLLPLLLSRTLNITGVTIDQPQVTLLRNPAGRWNFSSLGGHSASSSPGGAAGLTVGSIVLANGRLVVGRTDSPGRSVYDKVRIEAKDVSLTSSFPVTLSAGLPAGGTLALDGRVGPLDATDASLTPVEAKLTITGLDLASTGFLDPSAGLGGVLDVEGTLSSKGGVAETRGTAKLTKAMLVAGGSPSTVPVAVAFDTRYNLPQNTGVLAPSTITIGGATARLDGTYDRTGQETAVQLAVRGQGMPAKDLEAFLPAVGLRLPSGTSLQAGTLDADLRLTGPVNHLVTSGSVGLFNGVLAGFDLGSRLKAVAALAGVSTGKNLDIEKLTADLRVAPNGIQASNLLAIVPKLGRLAGMGTIDARNALDFKMAATLSSSQPGAAPAPAQQAAPPPAQGGLAGLFGRVQQVTQAARAVTGGCGGGSGLTVPFQVKGTMADPKFIPDVGGLAAGLLKSKLGCF